jgi:hypothetical protein
MRAINRPSLKPIDVLKTCFEHIGSSQLRGKFERILNDLSASASHYDAIAKGQGLYAIPPAAKKANSEVGVRVIGEVTDLELKSLYTLHLVPDKTPGRKLYDKLMGGALGSLCPYCGFGHATTLDHYLPKSKFPLYSVLPSNLIPSCKDCNTGKSSDLAESIGEQSINPYFDHDKGKSGSREHFFNEQWLFARVLQTEPVTLEYFVDPPATWDDISKERVHSHFKSYKLGGRLPVQTSVELSFLRISLQLLGDESDRAKELSSKAKLYFQVHKNSWQTAMFQALSTDPWYCLSGFALE